MVALTGRREAYYSDYRGHAGEFVAAAANGFLFQGQYSRWQRQPRGTPALDLPAESFVVFLQNHDQIANSAAGTRGHALTSPGAWRAMTGFLLLMPGNSNAVSGSGIFSIKSVLYFADFKDDLARGVAKGRRTFLAQFPSLASEMSRHGLGIPPIPKHFAARSSITVSASDTPKPMRYIAIYGAAARRPGDREAAAPFRGRGNQRNFVALALRRRDWARPVC